MAKHVRREIIGLKVESIYNNDSVPTAAADAMLVENLSWGLEGLRMVERNPVRPSLAKLASIYAGSLISISFDAEIKGSGTAGTPPEIGAALIGCGMSETIVAITSVDYKCASTGHQSVTIYLWEDGSVYRFTGCLGSVSGSIETGAKGMLSFNFTGHIAGKSDIAFPIPAYDDTVPPALINVPFSVGGYNAVINALSFDLSNEILTPPSISSPDGYAQIRINGRDVNGSFDPEATTFAVKDFLAELQANTTFSLNCGDAGAVAGNKWKITMPAINYKELSNGDREGLRTREVGFEAREVTTDDEFSLLFT